MPPTQGPWRLSTLWEKGSEGWGWEMRAKRQGELEKGGLQRNGGGLQPLGLITH